MLPALWPILLLIVRLYSLKPWGYKTLWNSGKEFKTMKWAICENIGSELMGDKCQFQDLSTVILHLLFPSFTPEYGHICMYTCIPEEGTRLHYRWMWTTMWLLGTEIRTLKEQVLLPLSHLSSPKQYFLKDWFILLWNYHSYFMNCCLLHSMHKVIYMNTHTYMHTHIQTHKYVHILHPFFKHL